MNTVNAVDKQHIAMVHTLLHHQYGELYADIWKLGVNLALRISDLLRLQYADLNLNERTVTLTEAKTGKRKTLRLNSTALAIINQRKTRHPDHTWLFEVTCNRAKQQPIHRSSVSRAFKAVGKQLGLTLSTHSMRKSRGKALYDDGVPIEKIAKVLNHSNTTSTLRYLGITQEEVLKTYDEYEL